jgi:uncharacterized protein YjiS (DUF1127 family)
MPRRGKDRCRDLLAILESPPSTLASRSRRSPPPDHHHHEEKDMNTPNTRRPTDSYRFEASVRRAAWTWLGKQIAALIARHQALQTARRLSALSDRELLDVGLLRADIERVAGERSRA